MKKYLICFGLTFWCGVAGASLIADANEAANIAEARNIIQGFAKDLGGRLKSAMKEGGPVKAIDVCRLEAAEVTEKASEASGWFVARTSLKVRNPGNEADDWELKRLRDFNDLRASGVEPKKIEYSEIVEADGERQFRFMKAIPTQKLCLTCHGADLKGDVKDALNSYYPDDQAIGFKEGDLRGAFTLIKPLR